MRQKNKPPISAVVGIVDSPEALRKATKLPAGSVDFLEWRADCLRPGLQIPASRFPWILTVRHPLEGGANELPLPHRRAIFSELLPATVLDDARRRKVRVVASFHDFKKTPPAGKLRDVAARAHDAGADILKIATRTGTPGDVCRLLECFAFSRLPLAVMGMGPLGFSSRILFAHSGSVLNYGWLHRPNVPGQWSALEMKRILKSAASVHTVSRPPIL